MHVTGWIPPALPHARADRRWLLTGVDSKNSGLDAVRGHALDAGATYSLPAHSLVIGVEDLDEPARQQVRLWQAQANGAIKLAESWICTPTLDRALIRLTTGPLATGQRLDAARILADRGLPTDHPAADVVAGLLGQMGLSVDAAGRPTRTSITSHHQVFRRFVASSRSALPTWRKNSIRRAPLNAVAIPSKVRGTRGSSPSWC